MFCYNCGKEIEDDSTFCPFCGAKQNEEEKKVKKTTKKEPKVETPKQTKPKVEAPKQTQPQAEVINEPKPKSKMSLWLLIGIPAGALVIGVIIFFVVISGGNSVKVLQGDDVVFDGYNGYGSAYVNETKIAEHFTKPLLKKYQEIQTNYTRSCSLNNVLSERCIQLQQQVYVVENALESLDFDIVREDGGSTDELSNGDTITVITEYDEMLFRTIGLKLNSTTKNYKVSGLANLQEMNVLQYAEAEWASDGGSFYLNVKAKAGSPIDSIPCTVSDPDENGDVIVTVDGRKLASQYGYTVSEANKSTKIHVGQKPQTLDHLTDDNRSKVEELAIKVLSEVYASKCGYNLYSEKVDQTELIIVPSASDITNLQVSNGHIRASFNVSTDKGNVYPKTITFDAYVDQDGSFKYNDIEKDGLSCAIKRGQWPEFE